MNILWRTNRFLNITDKISFCMVIFLSFKQFYIANNQFPASIHIGDGGHFNFLTIFFIHLNSNITNTIYQTFTYNTLHMCFHSTLFLLVFLKVIFFIFFRIFNLQFTFVFSLYSFSRFTRLFYCLLN